MNVEYPMSVSSRTLGQIKLSDFPAELLPDFDHTIPEET
jgi:hypothetical protein